ncbi:MAG: GntR family transcriptional regulator [Acidimicrobiia bacterium]|nr:GntR family transcriptional regulator [Acidimicrobiia bacterium]
MTQAPPLWRQVRADIESRIRGGEFEDRFPTDQELTRHYGVSRHTIREAVRSLQEDGVIVRRKGSGSFVAADRIEQPMGTIYSLFETVQERGMVQRSLVLSLRETTDARAAVTLEKRPGTPLVVLERIRLVDGEALAHDIAWIPADIGRPLLDTDFTATSLYGELLGRCAVAPTAGTERIRPVVPSSRIAAHLGTEPGDPALEIDRRTWWNGAPLEWRVTVVRGDRYAFRADWSEDSTAIAPRLVPR